MQNLLMSWYNTSARQLPWRDPGTDPWAILVCEVMSQQTPIARVLPAWEEWMARWPDPTALAEASPAHVIIAWGTLGYPRRALRLQECAGVVVEQWDGTLPRSREDLLSLPGIGPYTADAIIAFAYRERTTVLDVNVRRVLARIYGEAAPPTSLKAWEVERASHLVPDDGEAASQWNAAIMELGALICTARNPRCEQCPIAPHCAWLELGKPEAATPRKVQAFEGTHRQARGKVMRVLRTAHAPIGVEELRERSGLPEVRFEPALTTLLADGLAAATPGGIQLPIE